MELGHQGRGKCGPGPRNKGPSKLAEPRCGVVDQKVQADGGYPGHIRTGRNILLMSILHSEHPEYPSYSHHETIILKITLCIDQKSINMVPNIYNVPYIHMPNAGNQQARPG